MLPKFGFSAKKGSANINEGLKLLQNEIDFVLYLTAIPVL